MNNKQKLNINGKSISFRYNASRTCFEANYGFKNSLNQRQSRIIRGKSVDELKQKIEDFIKSVTDNTITSSSVTLENFFSFYIKSIAIQNNRNSTISTKRNLFKLIPSYIRSTSLDKLNTMQLQLMYTELSSKYKPNTIKAFHQLLNTVLNYAVKNKVILNNPNQACVVRNYKAIEKLFLTPIQINDFLQFLKQHHTFNVIYRPVLLLAYSACRKGEAIGLKKDCVDVKNCVVSIKGQINMYGYTEHLKTTNSRRVIKLPKAIIDELVKYSNDSDFCFTNYTNYPFTSSNFSDLLREAGREYGLPISAKTFRNSFVKNAILNGIPLKVIQNILGHAQLSTTADIYGNLNSQDTFYTADIIEKVYNSNNHTE